MITLIRNYFFPPQTKEQLQKQLENIKNSLRGLSSHGQTQGFHANLTRRKVSLESRLKAHK